MTIIATLDRAGPISARPWQANSVVEACTCEFKSILVMQKHGSWENAGFLVPQASKQ
jgi:hypothetical protein